MANPNRAFARARATKNPKELVSSRSFLEWYSANKAAEEARVAGYEARVTTAGRRDSRRHTVWVYRKAPPYSATSD